MTPPAICFHNTGSNRTCNLSCSFWYPTNPDARARAHPCGLYVGIAHAACALSTNCCVTNPYCAANCCTSLVLIYAYHNPTVF